MKIRFIQDWRAFKKGQVVDTIAPGSAASLIQRKIAEPVAEPTRRKVFRRRKDGVPSP